MVHGRIETTPEQQLIDLRKAYERYVKLADVLHDSGDAALDADERQAREHYARRIAHAYEKTIANTSARMESMRRDHMVDHSFRRWMVIAVLLVIAGLFASSALLAAFLPEIFRPAQPRQRPHAVPALEASVAAPASAAPTEIAPPAISPSVAQPVIAPPKAAANNAPAAKTAPGRASTPAPTVRPATAPTAKVEILKASAPRVTAPVREASAPPTRVAEAPRVTPPPQVFTPPAAATPAPTPAPPPPAVIATAVPPAAPPPAVASSPAPAVAVSTASNAAAPAPVLRDTSVQIAALPPVAAPAQAARPSTPATPGPTRLESIASTHRPPPYPDMSKRAGEQGTTQMQVAISTAGVITDCNVTGTSGSQRLDAAACSYVQAHWKWQPPLKDGQPASVTTKISVIWSLATAARN